MIYDDLRSRGGVIKIFWPIELNGLWSKKICRPMMTVWSSGTFILRWSCYNTKQELNAHWFLPPTPVKSCCWYEPFVLIHMRNFLMIEGIKQKGRKPGLASESGIFLASPWHWVGAIIATKREPGSHCQKATSEEKPRFLAKKMRFTFF